MPEHIHFVTGRLAEPALREQVETLSQRRGFAYSIEVMPITVAALMTPAWIAKRWRPPAAAHRVILPGYCTGDLAPLVAATDATIERGPRDLRRLPEYFGTAAADDYGGHSIEILAEINHAPSLSLGEVLSLAQRYAGDGADVIDLGCAPGARWSGVGDCVAALRDAGLRVSIDTFDTWEAAEAVRRGAELVLSVNGSNREQALDWGAEVVVIPDEPTNAPSMYQTADFLVAKDVPFRLDPILEPIGCGFAASLQRYWDARRRFPDTPMMMGVGNLTELSEVDSAGINLLLAGYCAELNIHSVLTTEVIHWSRASVRELDIARRMVDYAVRHQTPPKHLDPRLVVARGGKPSARGQPALRRLAEAIRDPNYRIFAEDDTLHVMNHETHLDGSDPFALFAQLLTSGPDGERPERLDASHAFYLGYELAKATTALTLGKAYEQDEALDWGHMTRPEDWTPLSRRRFRPEQP